MNKSNLVKSDFDKIALLPTLHWNSNAHYHKYLLQKIPNDCRIALDVGCGKGAFSHELKSKALEVLGIDLSPNMIAAANESLEKNDNVSFQLGDYLKAQYPTEHFDCIISIATIHHMQFDQFLIKAKSELRTNGKLIILDLYQQSTIKEYFLSLVALPLKKIMSLIHNGTLNDHKNVKKLWVDHGRNDQYMTIKQLKQAAKNHLQSFALKRHLFWRYSLIWTKKNVQPT